MSSLADQPPRPRAQATAPLYPRLVGASAVAAVLVACPGGVAPEPFYDAGTGGYAVSYGGSAGAGAGAPAGGAGGEASSVGEGGAAGAIAVAGAGADE